MINMTHTVGGFSLSLLLVNLNLGVLSDASIWAILFSIYLGQLPDLDLEKSSISKRFGFYSIGVVVRKFSKEHRKETHSIFFCLLGALLLFPLAYFFHTIDGSSIMGNLGIFFFGIFSHLLLDLFNIQKIPLFYIPFINPILKAKLYGISDFTLNYIKGIKVESEKEFRNITIPLLLLSLYLIIDNWSYYQNQILKGSLLIEKHVYFAIFLLSFLLWKNYFIRKGGFKDFLYSLYSFFTTREKEKFINWKYLKSALREGNFTQILLTIFILFSFGVNSDYVINSLGDFFTSIYSFMNDIFKDGINKESLGIFIKVILSKIF